MSRADEKWNPPPPGTNDHATFTVNDFGQVVATLRDGLSIKSNSTTDHLLYAILRRLEGRTS